MRSERATYLAIRRLLLARASSLAVRVALRPRGWAPGLLAAGLIGVPAPALAQEIIDLATDAELTIQGAAEGNGSGFSVSRAGDVNGDGIDDLIIGATGAAPNGRSAAGAGYVVFGTDEGFPPTIDLATDADLTIQGAAAYDLSGYSVGGAGDVNGDGIDDLIIGAPFASPNGRLRAGASYVVFGTDQGFPATIDLASDADVTIQGAIGDYSGFSVSGAGDVDGDGIDDLLIGAKQADPNGRELAGASYVVFGTDQGFSPIIDLATEADVTIQGAAPGDLSGHSVSRAGDVNGDGIDDHRHAESTERPTPEAATSRTESDARSAGLSRHGQPRWRCKHSPAAESGGAVNHCCPGGRLSRSDRAQFAEGGIMRSKRTTYLAIRRLLLARASSLAVRVALRPRGWAPGLLAVGLISAQAPALAQETIDLASDADLTVQGAAANDLSGLSVSGAGDINGDGIDDLIVGAP